jgi:ribosomal protein S27AE
MRQDYTADPIVNVTEVTKRDAFSATETNVRFCPSLLPGTFMADKTSRNRCT